MIGTLMQNSILEKSNHVKDIKKELYQAQVVLYDALVEYIDNEVNKSAPEYRKKFGVTVALSVDVCPDFVRAMLKNKYELDLTQLEKGLVMSKGDNYV